jgi:hypothetical protein
MDGRVQLPVASFLLQRFGTTYVDAITEPGPIQFFVGGSTSSELDSIYRRIDISVGPHGSRGIALVGHHDCAGNPISEAEQRVQTAEGVKALAERYPLVEVIGLWVDSDWVVHEMGE